MKIDPRLLKALEEREDANLVLAEALGVCPACGQSLPTRQVLPNPNGQKSGEKRLMILEWRRRNPDGTQSECARALQSSQTYVGRVWHEADAKSPRDEADE